MLTSALFFRRTARLEEFDAQALPWLDEIYRTAVGLLGGSEHASDLTQDVFLNAWKSFDRFEPGTNIRAWLHKILVHRAAHFRHTIHREQPLGNKDEPQEDIPDEIVVPDYLSDRQVAEAVAQMSGPFREAVVLADVRGFSYKEIAEMVQVPIGTVMSRLNRGRKQLRELLENIAREKGLLQ